jgi:hypothetical protein
LELKVSYRALHHQLVQTSSHQNHQLVLLNRQVLRCRQLVQTAVSLLVQFRCLWWVRATKCHRLGWLHHRHQEQINHWMRESSCHLQE